MIRKAHPARSMRAAEQAARELRRKREGTLSGAAWDMAHDMAINDGGRRVQQLEQASATLLLEEEDLQAARLIVLLELGEVAPLPNGGVKGTIPSTVKRFCDRYPEVAQVWDRGVRSLQQSTGHAAHAA